MHKSIRTQRWACVDGFAHLAIFLWDCGEEGGRALGAVRDYGSILPENACDCTHWPALHIVNQLLARRYLTIAAIVPR